MASSSEPRHPELDRRQTRCSLGLFCAAEWHRNALREGVPVPESIRFAYLKGTYEEINRRLSLRVGHFMPESLLSSQFATLEEPDSFEALAVDVNQPVAIIVDSIVARLQLGSSTRLAQG